MITQRCPRKRQPKHLNNSLTGTYERSGRFQGASLDVVELTSGKIKFYLSAANGLNSGEAAGVVSVENGIATFKSDPDLAPFQLHFEFAGKACKVTMTGNEAGFGGMGVTLWAATPK